MNFKRFIFHLIVIIPLWQINAQEPQEKKKYTIDFSGIQNQQPPDEEPKPESISNTDILGIGFLKQQANLSQNAISAFNIKSIIDIDNFGKEKKDHLKFGKPSDAKTYLDVVYEPLPLKTDSVDFFFGDIDLGTYTTKADHLYLIIRDSMATDGDEIKVSLNDKVIFNRITFHSSFIDYRVALTEGFNKIELLAIDSGVSEPVTCQLVVVDGLDNKLFDKSFNIAVGYKAKFVVVKE
ncbi:hypothetical protein [Aquimarina agarilytica]|uniref:hypothetical protein n=1 Tax=Aquimarina agarilytica TaxID=1087449 RepID=UPI000287D77B|nr:hypothetical protein [Aquimarina agarilytica]